ADPDRVADDDDYRGGHDGARMVDARPLRARRPADVARRTGPHPAVVVAAAVQQARLLLPGPEPDLAGGTRPLPGGPRVGTGAGPRVHPVGPQPVARDSGAVWPVVLVDRARNL